MPTGLRERFALIEDEFAGARRAPLSARKVLLVATLLDNFPDRVFDAFYRKAPDRLLSAADVLAYRRELRTDCPAMGDVFDLCAMLPAGPRLVTHAVEVPIADYPSLSVEDFMVSLYNRNSVQRVLVAWPDGSEKLAHDVLAETMAWWRQAGVAD